MVLGGRNVLMLSSSQDDTEAPGVPQAPPPVDLNAAFAARAREVAAQDAVDVGRMASLVGGSAKDTLKTTLDSINGAIDPSLRPRPSDAQLKAKGLLSAGEWDATLLALAAVVLVAVFSQVAVSGPGSQVGLQAEPGAYVR
ncbi:hypothetical protein KFE25_007097 [Diacronema lutheri]|uniref:Uncharacterized protein n=1 Tax=Diacronema lutheri TaxID=2081491 RepID=A0A8J5XU84_DIALT|nr:hypothetical protein KFE25_007097 [Diacronema lutheri]